MLYQTVVDRPTRGRDRDRIRVQEQRKRPLPQPTINRLLTLLVGQPPRLGPKLIKRLTERRGTPVEGIQRPSPRTQPAKLPGTGRFPERKVEDCGRLEDREVELRPLANPRRIIALDPIGTRPRTGRVRPTLGPLKPTPELSTPTTIGSRSGQVGHYPTRLARPLGPAGGQSVEPSQRPP